MDNYDFDKKFTIKKFNVLGIKGSIKIRIKIKSLIKFLRTFEAEIIIETNKGGEVIFGSTMAVSLSKTFDFPEKENFFYISKFYICRYWA